MDSGSNTLHMAPSYGIGMMPGAVTRLSYPATLDFSRCRRFRSPSAALRISTYSAAYVCGTGHPLTVDPQGRTDYLLSSHGRSLGHFLPSAVSVSPSLISIIVDGLGRRRGIAPRQRTVAAWRAPLRAPRYGGSPLTDWQSEGAMWASVIWGWRPQHSQSVRSRTLSRIAKRFYLLCEN